MSHVRKAALIAAVGSWIVRLISATLRFRFHDEAGVLAKPPELPVIWAFWHNRLFIFPHMYGRYFPKRRGAALTSASKDGEILAAFLQKFGIQPVRGSSSRRGGVALVEMKALVARGHDIGITPDGPRGPCYRLNPGVIKLAQATGAPVLPVRVRYSSCWRLKSWDQFMIPRPFARVDLTLAPLHRVPETPDDTAFETERARLEAEMRGD